MKKFIAKFALTMIATFVILAFNAGVETAGADEAPVADAPGEVNTGVQAAGANTPGADMVLQSLREVGREVEILQDFDAGGQHPDAPPSYEEGVGAITSPILFAIDFLRLLISGIAFIVVIVTAIKLITNASEEEVKKAKTTLLMAVAGLILIQLADPLVKRMFFGEMGEAFEDIATAEMFAEETVSFIRGIIGLLHIFLGAIAVLVIIIRGFTLVVSGGDEEALKKAKSHVLYAVIGLGVVGLSEVIVRGFIFPEEGDKLPDVGMARTIIVSVTNYISGFIAIISFLVLFYAGYYYVVSGGEDEATAKVKKIVTSAVIGLVLAMAAFAIVNTVLQLP